MKSTGRIILFITLSIGLLASCVVVPGSAPQPTATPFQPAPGKPVSEPSQMDVSLYLPPGFPAAWSVDLGRVAGVSLVDDAATADLVFNITLDPAQEAALFSSSQVYAAAVPFFTVEDSFDPDLLPGLWRGAKGKEESTYLVSDETAQVLESIWGKPGRNVSVAATTDLLALAEENQAAIAIIPFEEITPRWKILKLNGFSPLDKPFELQKYPLSIYYHLVSNVGNRTDVVGVAQKISEVIPVSNRDESKLSIVVMSGTTAITRGLAYKVLINDTDYPVALVKDWFLSADVRHVSNESPFVEDCPDPDPYTPSLVFCTSPDMIEVFEKIGINVVELTGNHINDHGLENLEKTMQLYKDRGWAYYAAGINAEAAREPVLLEHNGNKIAFIGCNAVGPNSVWAKEDRPGAADCDFAYLDKTIRDLKNRGYVVITTFQHEELSKQDGAPAVLMFAEKISGDFLAVAEAGADIVQGSQAHYPMGFEFVSDSLVHYGLGNFLFDQMWEPNRNEFIDRHILYDGKYINTEILTAVLMDWSQPTPMDALQRAEFLEEIFQASMKRKK